MTFYSYIYAPKQTQLSWVWDMLVITNSTQISREYEISGLSLSLSLSLRFVSDHHPLLSFSYHIVTSADSWPRMSDHTVNRWHHHCGPPFLESAAIWRLFWHLLIAVHYLEQYNVFILLTLIAHIPFLIFITNQITMFLLCFTLTTTMQWWVSMLVCHFHSVFSHPSFHKTYILLLYLN